MSKHTCNNRRIGQVAFWIQHSPWIVVLTAIAISFAYYNNNIQEFFEEPDAKPRIQIASFSTAKRQSAVHLDRLIGDGLKWPISGSIRAPYEEGNPVLLPYLSVGISFSNPLSRPTTFAECALHARFWDSKEFESLGSVRTKEFVNDPAYKASEPIAVDPGSVKSVDILFFYLPTPEFKESWSDSLNGVKQVWTTCVNENGDVMHGSDF